MQTKLQRKFYQYHLSNPRVYREYKRFADELHQAGVKRKSINMITERIRWETATSGDDEFKINNDYRACYARLLMWRHPYLRGSFALRGSGVDGHRPVQLEDCATWDRRYWREVSGA